jgi:L-ascorbate metabolism protein UlaG (beta-lactamase superfamily)
MTAIHIGWVPALLALAACSHPGQTARVYYSGPPSDHFDGQKFFNSDGEDGSGGAERDGRKQFLSIAFGKAKHTAWPSSVPVTPTKPPARVEGQAMRVTWIGHATTLVQTQGLNILIDPVWSHRDSPVPFAGPKRVRAPGVRLEDLPKIDLVLISHNHYDHLDIGALRRIAQRDRPLIITALGNDTLLRENGITAQARDWDQEVEIRPGVEVILTRAHHWSAHRTVDEDRALWCGFFVRFPGGGLYYAGDTGAGQMRWPEEARRYGPIRLAILPIGPYHVATPPSGNHIDPEQAVSAFAQLDPAYALGVHWGTFELTDEPIDGPPTRLREAARKKGLAEDRFRTLEAGEAWDIPPVGGDLAYRQIP